MAINENYREIYEIIKYEPIIKIDFELNKFYSSLDENEIIDFLKWLEFELLIDWKISRKSNENQSNLIVKKLFSNYAEFFSQKIDYLDKWIIEKNANQTQQPKAVKLDEVKKEFKDFFNSDVKPKVIESIQNDFKDFKGKKMAYLIYLLHRDFKVINYSLNSKTESRKHFVSILKGCDFRMTGIDKYFKNADVTLDGSETKDPDYFDIKEKLLKTIK